MDEVLKLKNELNFHFKNTKKGIILTEEDEEDFKDNKICRFGEKETLIDKVRDHCHLTGKYRGPARNTCNSNVTQKQNNFVPLMFHNFCNYDGHLFLKILVGKK